MWVHDHAHEPDDHRRSRAVTDPAPAGGEAARILALQRAAGNAAVTAYIQRTSTQGGPLQIADQDQDDTQDQDETAQVEPTPADKNPEYRKLRRRARELSEKFGIRIGPAPNTKWWQILGHFNDAMLDRIEAALTELPLKDLKENLHLVAIEYDPHPVGDESLYSKDTRSIGIVRPRVLGPVRAPSRLYAAMNMDNPWQFGKMESGALSGYEGISAAGDEQLTIAPGSRSVMEPQGPLLQWTLRHEIGHSVDQKFGWSDSLAALPHFGGWRTYDLDVEADASALANAVLEKAQLHNVLPPSPLAAHVAVLPHMSTLATHLRTDVVRERLADGTLARYFNRFQPHLPPATFETRRDIALNFLRMAVAQPWTLANGGGNAIVHNGRVHQIDHYGHWVSYLNAERQFKVSNYQFSTADEWFAEAYAAYYNRTRTELRGRLNPQVQQWFKQRGDSQDYDTRD
jgi:hypothetical protein